MQAVREAALRPRAAERYPYLPAGMWTAAAHLTELVARYRGIAVKVRDRTNRVLSNADFMFRGGGESTQVSGLGGSQRVVG